MLSFETFKNTLEHMKEMEDKVGKVYDLGIDVFGFCADDYVAMLIDVLEDAICDKDEWVTYWVTECAYGDDICIWVDEDDNEYPLETVEDLWYVITGEIVGAY